MSKESAPRQISVAEMAPHVHSFLSGENKVNKISAEKLHNAFVSRELEHTGYIYYDPERSIYNQISNQLEKLLV